MTNEQKLYELLKDFDPAVGERMEKHFRDGAFYFDLGGSSYPFFEGNTVYTVIPHFAEKGSEGIVKKSVVFVFYDINYILSSKYDTILPRILFFNPRAYSPNAIFGLPICLLLISALDADPLSLSIPLAFIKFFLTYST